MKKASHLYY